MTTETAATGAADTGRRWPSYGEARALLKTAATARAGHPRRLSVTLAGNASMEFLIPGLHAALDRLGFEIASRALPMDGWVPVALEGSSPSDVWVIWISALGASRGQTERAALDIEAIAAAVAVLKARGILVVLILPEALDAEDDPFSPFAAWRQDLVAALRERIGGDAILLSVESIQRQLGSAAWVAKRYWSVAKVPCHPDAATAVGWTAGETVARALRQDIRAVIVDLDDTIWAGVVGDDGVAGLGLDRDGPGRPHLEMQRFLKDLSERGIPVSVVSKNDAAIAERPFQEREEMILRKEDLVFFEASWESKHGAIQRIIDALNLSPNQVCFLDDSPFERDQAREFVPGLVVPDLPADPEQRVAALVSSGLFSLPVLRQEDRKRVEMYKAERMRREAAATLDEGEYLRSLKMVLRAIPVSDANLPRVSSLIQKTNQFNVTDARPSPREIGEFSQSRENYAFVFGLEDRFGDYGLISVVLAERDEDAALMLRNWVMSCRVFNRGVEAAVLEHLVRWAEDRRARTLRGLYRPTEKNRLLSDILPRIGLKLGESKEDAVAFQYDGQAALPPHFIQVTTQADAR